MIIREAWSSLWQLTLPVSTHVTLSVADLLCGPPVPTLVHRRRPHSCVTLTPAAAFATSFWRAGATGPPGASAAVHH